MPPLAGSLSLDQVAGELGLAVVLGTMADHGGVSDPASCGLPLLIPLAAGGLFAVIWRRLHGIEQMRMAIELNSVVKPQAMTSRSGNSATASTMSARNSSQS